jgi:uncharacterized cupredoxin-like copper-binding protein
MVRNASALVVVAIVAFTVTAAAFAARELASASNVTVVAGKPSELRFTLSKKTVPRGTVVFKVTNRGRSEHDFKIGGKTTKKLRAGQSTTLRVVLKSAGKYPYVCTVPGHALAGMKGVLTVK